MCYRQVLGYQRAPRCLAVLQGAAVFCPTIPPPSLSHKLHQPKTQYLQTTGSHITTLPVLKARTWSFKGGNKTTDHPTQTKRRLQRNTKVCTAIKR